MQYALLQRAGLHISRIGFGCMSLDTDPRQAEKLIRRAVDLGVNYFDTSDLYDRGLNEELVGRALKGCRKEVVLATKVGNQWRADGSGWDWNPRKEYILSAVEGSLKRLQTDHIDLYQLHGGTLQDPIEETIEAFELLVQQGKIRYYGISSIRPNVIREWVARSHMASVMTQYSLLDRRPEEETLTLLREKGIGVMVRGSVAQGLLVNKPPKPYLGYSEVEVTKAALAVQALSTSGRTPAQTAIRYVLHHPAVTSAVVGMRTGEQLEEAVAALTTPDLSLEEIERLNNILPVNQYTEHR
jgi:aryl-alcohol dehydrogenase-like predicted oxidoreductase